MSALVGAFQHQANGLLVIASYLQQLVSEPVCILTSLRPAEVERKAQQEAAREERSMFSSEIRSFF